MEEEQIKDKNQDEFKIRSFQEKIEEMPPEFILWGEEVKETEFKKTLSLVNQLIGKNGIDSFVDDEESKDGFIKMFEFIYSWGFYAGMEYTLAPWEAMMKKRKKLNNKTQE